jgi:hypothetical protein
MLTNLILFTLIMSSVSFIAYEISLNKKYKKELAYEKLISNFSYARMQIMKMLHLKEISADSLYFNFMIRATSFSIRTLYFYKNRREGLKDTKVLTEIMPSLINPKMKEEFECLNSEQKELFIRTILNILKLYIEDNYFEKLLLSIYLLEIKNVIGILIAKIIKRFSDKKTREKITYINDLDNSYNIRSHEYAFAC